MSTAITWPTETVVTVVIVTQISITCFIELIFYLKYKDVLTSRRFKKYWIIGFKLQLFTQIEVRIHDVKIQYANVNKLNSSTHYMYSRVGRYVICTIWTNIAYRLCNACWVMTRAGESHLHPRSINSKVWMTLRTCVNHEWRKTICLMDSGSEVYTPREGEI